MMSDTISQNKGLKRVFLCVSLGVLALLTPFFISASNEYPVRILDFYKDAANENRITIKWTYNPDYENGLPLIGAKVGILYFYFGNWSGGGFFFKEVLEDCLSEEGNLICKSIPTNYYHPYTLKLVENLTGLTYDDMAPYLEDLYLDEGYFTLYWGEGGGSTSTSFHFASFTWGDPPIEFCVLGFCSGCQSYETCIGAGCFWDYSFYTMEFYCAEPYEPSEEECGLFHKCQYCMTEESCQTGEEYPNCIWEDRGFGEKCYMREPTIPPAQVEWEEPELCDEEEECGELSGVEKWLCIIACRFKNEVAETFMPSQGKINTLYQTFGAFKGRVPFNYISALNVFFNDVKNSLDVQKSIPIKILGVESNVSFAFWDKTTTIGGQTETFKNILIDFTSLVIFIGWFVWLLSFIKRFFP